MSVSRPKTIRTAVLFDSASDTRALVLLQELEPGWTRVRVEREDTAATFESYQGEHYEDPDAEFDAVIVDLGAEGFALPARNRG